MAFDFPNAPVLNDVVEFADGSRFQWLGEKWKRLADTGTVSNEVWVEEAPEDSVPYARRNKAWVPADLMTADRPVLNTIAPATAAVTVTTPITVTITGSKFSVTAKVYFGNKLMPSAFISPSSMTFPLVPSAQTVGQHAVTVNNTGLSSQPRAFTIT